MGGSTVIIEDLAAYMASLHKVRHLAPERILPGHGAEIPDAVEMVDAYIAHRQERERQVLAAVANGADTVAAIVAVVYPGLASALVPAAVMQVETQLEKLAGEGRLEFRHDGATGRVVDRPPWSEAL